MLDQPKNDRKRNAYALMAITLMQLVFFHEQVFGSAHFWSGYWADITEFTASFIQFNSYALANWEFPFWNPYSYSGMPHMAEPTTSFFYPLNFLASGLINCGLSVFTWMKITTIFHFWLLQAGMYFLLRHYKLSLLPSLFGSIAFTFSTCMISKFMIPNFIITYAYLPVTLLVFNRLLIKKTKTDAIWLGLFMALMLLGGNPNILFFIIIFLFFYFIYWVYGLEKEKRTEYLKRVVLLLVLSLIIFILLCGAQISEVVDFLPFSQRKDITYDFASDGSLKWAQLSTIIGSGVFGIFKENISENMWWITPNKFYHYWETAIYFGVATWILSFIGFYNYLKRRVIVVGLISSFFFLLFALGDNGPIYKVLYNYIPGFDLYRIPSRALFVPVFVFCVASSFGLQKIMKTKKWGKSIWLPLGLGVVLFGVALIYVNSLTTIPKPNKEFVESTIFYALGFFFLSVLGIILMYKFPKSRTFLAFGFCLLVFVDLAISNKEYKNSVSDPEKAYLLDKTKFPVLYPKVPKEVFRIGPKSNRYRLISRNGGVHLKLFNTDGLYGVQRRVSIPKGTPSADLLSMKYYIAHQEDENGRVTGYGLEQRQGAFPYARMVYDYSISSEQPAELTDFDFTSQVALSEGFEGIESIRKGEIANNTVDIESYELNQRQIKVTSEHPGILVLAEHYYDGWKMYIDGKKQELLRVNYFQQGLFIPEGEHTVRVKYSKTKLNILIALYFCTIFGIVILFSLQFFRGTPKTST